jgi:hypothetical protein
MKVASSLLRNGLVKSFLFLNLITTSENVIILPFLHENPI